MKKTVLLIGVIFVAIASLAIAGYAYAQTQTPSDPNCPAPCPFASQTGSQMRGPGWDMMSRGQGMMGSRWNQAVQSPDGSYGLLHETMFAAMAKVFGLTPEELQARHDAGETMWDIAEEQGMTTEQFQEKMLQARTDTLNQAVTDGTTTQEQADRMSSRMAQLPMYGRGSGSAGCPGMGAGGMGGWRWNR